MPHSPFLSSEARTLIGTHLAALAAEHQVKIVYACESGSRAWGFPSPDSDYDVRFIYVHPKTWYLALEEGRDVIDLPIVDSVVGLLDFGGWDVRKTLRLARKSNPVIWEWLQSPKIYQGFDIGHKLSLRDKLDPFYSPITACHHYLSLARGTMERELGDPTVKIKKYFYMLRPLLAAAWIERYREVPPMELTPLLALLDGQPAIKASIDDLLKRKQVTDEQVPIARITVIDDFLAKELARLQESAKQLPAAAGDPAVLDGLFLAFLGVSE
ncbi:MAG: hypothetical protein CTY16_12735 [Methylobacter sp.]|nr:MAG: hypothetical protein CTY16_12735 [Methylobacter sp.]